MSEVKINIYFLPDAAKEKALCAILQKLREQGERAVVLASDSKKVERLDIALWTYRSNSFLAHGRSGDDFAEQQPIWLSDTLNHANGAKILVMFEPMADRDGDASSFQRWIVFVDPQDQGERANLEKLRVKWKAQGSVLQAFLSQQGTWQRLENEDAWPSLTPSSFAPDESTPSESTPSESIRDGINT